MRGEPTLADLRIDYPSFTSGDDVARALGAPPLPSLGYFVDTDGSVRRVEGVMVFREGEQVRQRSPGQRGKDTRGECP